MHRDLARIHVEHERKLRLSRTPAGGIETAARSPPSITRWSSTGRPTPSWGDADGLSDVRFRTDVWVPLPLDAGAWYHQSGVSRLIARLAPGGTLDTARSEFASLIDDVRREFDEPDDYGASATVLSLHEAVVGGVEPTLVVLQGTAVFILLIAGANVTHLLLMQAVGRTREMAVRAAVGAGLRQVVGQLLAENVLLTAAGGLLLAPRTDAAGYNRGYYGQVFERVTAVPGVDAVGAGQHLPLSNFSWSADLEIEGRPQPPGATPPSVSWRLVAHDYFRAMGVRLIEGRLFSAIEDRPGSTDVVLVNEALDDCSPTWGARSVDASGRGPRPTGGGPPWSASWATCDTRRSAPRRRWRSTDRIPRRAACRR